MLIDDTVPEFLNSRRRPVPQITSGVSHAKKLTKADARLTSVMAAVDAERTIRAFQPRPIAWVDTANGPLRIHRARPSQIFGTPGQITLLGTQIIASFDPGSIELLAIQPPGKPTIDAAAWMNGRRGESLTFE
jgi:methionyl-tRNA formyltransferase